MFANIGEFDRRGRRRSSRARCSISSSTSRMTPCSPVRTRNARRRSAQIGDHWTPREVRHSLVSVMSEQGMATQEIARRQRVRNGTLVAAAADVTDIAALNWRSAACRKCPALKVAGGQWSCGRRRPAGGV